MRVSVKSYCRIRRLPATLATWAAVVLVAHAWAWPQNSPATAHPYAAINRQAIDYAGPDRDAAHDLPGNEIKIGLILPRTGPRQSEGNALLAAAQMALEDEAREPLAGGRRLTLETRDESGLWGRASSEIVKLVVDDRAIALITSPDGRAAHLSEQVGNRLGVPVLTLASDSTTTQINIPWMFRIPPGDNVQARLFAEDIYRRRSRQNVLLLVEDDHDGRVGREEFEKAARGLNAAPPAVLEIHAPIGDGPTWESKINLEELHAIVAWTSAESAALALKKIAEAGRPVDFYVCQKALREPFMSTAQKTGEVRVWSATSDLPAPTVSQNRFVQRFRVRNGAPPGPAAREMYDAVRMIAGGLRRAGPNRARLRDSLAKLGKYNGVSGSILFDGAGNNQAAVFLASWR